VLEKKGAKSKSVKGYLVKDPKNKDHSTLSADPNQSPVKQKNNQTKRASFGAFCTSRAPFYFLILPFCYLIGRCYKNEKFRKITPIT
jgi:hypothetical protein